MSQGLLCFITISGQTLLARISIPIENHTISASLLQGRVVGDVQIGHYEKTKEYETDVLHPLSLS